MNILRVHENPGIKGGSEVYVRDVSAELDSRGHRNFKLFIEGNQKLTIHFNSQKIAANLAGISDVLDLLLKGLPVDIVHIHGLSNPNLVQYFLDRYVVVRTMHELRLVCPGYGKFWVRSSKPCTIPWGYHCFRHAYTEKCVRSRMPQNILRDYQNTFYEVHTASKKYATILTMSEYVRQEAILGGIPPEKIICNPHFTKFNLPYSLHDGVEKRFLFVGRLIKHKGVFELLDACRQIMAHQPHVFLDIVGDGPLRVSVNKYIRENDLSDRIAIYKWKSSEEVSEMMKSAYAVLFPSIYPEAFGLVGIEAAAHSKPVIAFDRGGISTWLKHGYNGYLLKASTADILAVYMNKLLSLPEEYALMSKNAWEWARSFFTPARHVDTLLSIYRNCIDAASVGKKQS